MISASKPRHPKRPPAPCVVYGPAFWNGDEMLVLPDWDVMDWAAYYLARNHATTWAGFLTALPDDDRKYFDQWSHQENEFASFAEYWEHRVDEVNQDEELTREQVWSDYLDLSWPDERPPLGDEPFDATSWAEIEFDCNLGPGDPQAAMTGSVPASILKEHGHVADSKWDGHMASLQMQNEEAIVAAYRKLGYRIIRNDHLIEAACGETGDPNALQRLLLRTDLFDDEPIPRPEDIESKPEPLKLVSLPASSTSTENRPAKTPSTGAPNAPAPTTDS
ncbi:MAG: hypothetical protein ACYDIE_14250 [Candidatus Krumholzibacteriia bacterium]